MLLQTKFFGGYQLHNCLWDHGCSLWKLLSSTPEETGHLSQLHVDSSPHLCYSHAPLQHLDANRMDLSTYGGFYPTTQRNFDLFVRIACHHDHVGSRWVHGEDSKTTPGIKIYNAIADMSRFVSGRFQTRSQGCNNCPPFTHFIGFFW